jgi:phage tail sheath protein FI
VVSPTFKTILGKVRILLNTLPPSAAMAGIYTAVDNSRGVWKAPANTSIASVVSPSVKLTHDDQEDLNLTVTGKSVNAIRSFIGQGTIVWGARTLDGNSQDWRYINVRRTLIFIEQSVKYAAKAYVYEPNTANSWVLIKSMISSFLNDLWKAGGLVGASPEQAYQVEIGLGTTMTPNDILDGVMKISVKVAISRPAEFIVITFQQKMQES